MHDRHRPARDDFHLFHREKRLLHGGLTLVATLLVLAALAFSLSRPGTVLNWATDLVATLLA